MHVHKHVDTLLCDYRSSKALAHYLLESSLQDYGIIQYLPSQLALVALKVCIDYFVDPDADTGNFEESMPRMFIDNILRLDVRHS